MKSFNKTLPLLGLAASLVYASSAAADFTGNITATSNYVWRGVTQTQDGAAIQGGLDYSGPLGFYVGTWASNTDFREYTTTGTDTSGASYEVDFYGGFAMEFGPVGVDVGYISYNYPQNTTDADEDLDYGEAYLGLSFEAGPVTVSLQGNYTSNYGTISEDALYSEIGLDYGITEDLTLSLHAGSYDFNDDLETLDGAVDYKDYSVSLTKGEFTFTFSDMDGDNVDFPQDEDGKIIVSWTHEIDLLK